VNIALSNFVRGVNRRLKTSHLKRSNCSKMTDQQFLEVTSIDMISREFLANSQMRYAVNVIIKISRESLVILDHVSAFCCQLNILNQERLRHSIPILRIHGVSENLPNSYLIHLRKVSLKSQEEGDDAYKNWEPHLEKTVRKLRIDDKDCTVMKIFSILSQLDMYKGYSEYQVTKYAHGTVDYHYIETYRNSTI
jgi:hypothetical protein